MTTRRALLTFVSTAVLSGCAGDDGEVQPSPDASSSSQVDSVSGMTDEELLGAVIMGYAYGDDAENVTDASRAANQALAGVDTPAEMVRDYHLGGLILMRFSADDPTGGTNPTSNLDSPEQVRRLTAGLHAAAGDLPLIIGIDQEFGPVSRINSGITQLPAAMGFGAAADPELTERAWRGVGTELAALGITADFAPDADVIANAGNTVIGARSYGSDPKAVAEQVTAVIKGLNGAGLAAAVKHFPGHGNTDVDSHKSMPELNQSVDELKDVDLVPFKAGIDAGVQFVMSGHLDVMSIDPGVPATLSSKVLIDLLRGELGFTGVVITDALQMQPITERYGAGEAAVRALMAGNDLLLMPENIKGAYDGLKAGLADGSLPRERLVEAAGRVTALRQWLKTAPAQPDMSVLNSSEAEAREAAAAAVTQVAGDCGKALDGPVRLQGGSEASRATLTAALRDRGVEIVESGGKLLQLTGFGDTTADIDTGADITVATNTPFILSEVSSPVRLAAFGAIDASMVAVAEVLTGKAAPSGKLPVAVEGLPASSC